MQLALALAVCLIGAACAAELLAMEGGAHSGKHSDEWQKLGPAPVSAFFLSAARGIHACDFSTVRFLKLGGRFLVPPIHAQS